MPPLALDGVSHVTRWRSHGRAGLWRARALATAITGSLIVAVYAERLFLARVVVELLLRLAQIVG
jgi:hypothetical protein